jgi:hypothetical protein
MISRADLVRLYWRQGKTLKAIGKLEGVSAAAVWKWMREQKVARRSRSQVQLARSNPAQTFHVAAHSKSALFLQSVGTILFWCEGTHREKRGRLVNTLAFTNSNEQMLVIWLRFLREICHVREEKVRVRLYLHPYQDAVRLRRHWSKVLKVPIKQFESVTVTTQHHSKRNRLNYQGTVKIKVHNQALVQELQSLIVGVQRQLTGSSAGFIDVDLKRVEEPYPVSPTNVKTARD